MTLDLNALLLLGLLSASIHWIVARSKAMQWFWGASWLPAAGKALLECTACSGFWLGLGLGLAGIQPLSHGPLGVACSGLLGVVATPVVEGVLLWGLRMSAIDTS